MRAELLQLQLRAARGLGDMAKVAELHQAMAKSLAQDWVVQIVKWSGRVAWTGWLVNFTFN